MDKKGKQGAVVGMIIIIAVATVITYAVISAEPPPWQTDDKLSSVGPQGTTQFTMNNTWRVTWVINQTDPIFVLQVYIKGSTGGYSWVTDTSTMTTNSTWGILPVYYVGTFIMQILALNNTLWVLEIQEPKTA